MVVVVMGDHDGIEKGYILDRARHLCKPARAKPL